MVTLLAFVVLGGIGYAAATINGKDIKRHSEPGNRLKNHTLTAKQVKAPKLHLVGRPGEPSFQHGCANAGSITTHVGFFKDDQGVVYLQGTYVCPSPDVVAFQLPRGYRPATGKHADFPLAGGDPGNVVAVAGPKSLGPAGAVESSKTIGLLDGDTFRAQG
jgi:hypothetical protein